jgi:PIN domain nuclease of toxin-antitoxin system
LILLDTNAFIWLVSGDPLLGPKSSQVIEKAGDERAIRISPITLWEISMLAERSRINLEMGTLAWIETALMHAGIGLEPVNPIIAVDAGRLPGNIHGDPADRIVIATARFLNCPLLTTDRKILDYAAQGHVEAFDARL